MSIKKILAVDDSPQFRELYASLLKSAGYEIRLAENGEEGLAMAKSERPDLVITDVNMPGMHGFQLLRRLRSEAALKNVPVIVCSTRASEDEQAWGREQGADLYLIKPIDQSKFLNAIKALEKKCDAARK